MPIYEYQCQNCWKTLEVIQKVSDSPLVTCQKCGKNSLQKLVSPTQFQLKGSGWYVTDFRNKESKPQKETASKDTKESTNSTPSSDKSDD
jgi:putative FmdB family regulatory protein